MKNTMAIFVILAVSGQTLTGCPSQQIFSLNAEIMNCDNSMTTVTIKTTGSGDVIKTSGGVIFTADGWTMNGLPQYNASKAWTEEENLSKNLEIFDKTFEALDLLWLLPGAGLWAVGGVDWNAICTPQGAHCEYPVPVTSGHPEAICFFTDGLGKTITVIVQYDSCTSGEGEGEGENFTLTTSVQGEGAVTGAGSYPPNTKVTVTAIASTGWSFDHWTVNGTPGYSNPGTVDMDGNVTLIAFFKQNTVANYTLTINVYGNGTVTGAGSYPSGKQVSISAIATAGSHFDHWTQRGIQSVSNPETIVMTEDVAVAAYFTLDQTPPPTIAAGVEFTSNGVTGTMRINPGTASLRAITADASALYLPSGATFADITSVGVEIVNLPSPYWYLQEASAGILTANNWSTIISLDGNGQDKAGVAKTVPLGNWNGGHAIPFYALHSVPGIIFSLNTGINSGTFNGAVMKVDTTGYIWPASK